MQHLGPLCKSVCLKPLGNNLRGDTQLGSSAHTGFAAYGQFVFSQYYIPYIQVQGKHSLLYVQEVLTDFIQKLTVCPGSSDPFYVVTTSWTDSMYFS